VKEALVSAAEIDKSSPAGAIELGHFLDAVEDDPEAQRRCSAKAFHSQGVLLLDGLLGQARALVSTEQKQGSK